MAPNFYEKQINIATHFLAITASYIFYDIRKWDFFYFAFILVEYYLQALHTQ